MIREKSLLIAIALVLFLIPTASATLNITDSSGNDITQITKTAVHNSLISLPIFFVKNTESVNITNITMTIGRITNASDLISIGINETKKTILPGNTTNYTIDSYSIPQYLAPGTYTVPINVSGVNTTGTAFSDSINAVITVNESKSLSVSSSTIGVSTSPGSKANTTFILTNAGNTNITNIALTQSTVLQDTDNDTITLSITADRSLSILQPGQSATITIQASAGSNINVGTYTTNIVANSSEGVSATVQYTATITQSFCSKGRIGGWFTVEIKNPDAGDDFYPNDVISIEVKVDNDDDDEHDIIIEADLFDTTDGKFIDETVDTSESIADDIYENYALDLKVPLDVTESHGYRLYVKVYSEDEEEKQCNEDYVSIDLKRETHAILIDKIEVPSSVSCGSSFDITTTLIDTGKKDEDVKLKITNSELKIDEEKTFSLDRDDKKKITLTPQIPKDAAEKNYTFTVQALYHFSSDSYQDSTSKTVQVVVKGNCLTAETTTKAVLSSETLAQPYANEQAGIKLTLFNTGSVRTTYTLSVSGYEDWAILNKIEPAVLTIDANSKGEAFVYLTPLQSVTGEKKFTVKAVYGDKKAESQVALSIKERISAPSMYQSFATKLSNLSGFDLMTVNAVLVIAVILTIAWILRVRKRY